MARPRSTVGADTCEARNPTAKMGDDGGERESGRAAEWENGKMRGTERHREGMEEDWRSADQGVCSLSEARGQGQAPTSCARSAGIQDAAKEAEK